jgi:hypothetical protein
MRVAQHDTSRSTTQSYCVDSERSFASFVREGIRGVVNYPSFSSTREPTSPPRTLLDSDVKSGVPARLVLGLLSSDPHIGSVHIHYLITIVWASRLQFLDLLIVPDFFFIPTKADLLRRETLQNDDFQGGYISCSYTESGQSHGKTSLSPRIRPRSTYARCIGRCSGCGEVDGI